MRRDLARHQVADDDARRAAVFDHQLEHLVPRVELHGAELHLPHQCLVRTEFELLPGLAAGVERSRNLGTTERAVVQQATVLPRERHALCGALVDDVHADLREPVDVRFAGAIVTALDGVVEEAIDAVAVVLVVLRGVNAALRCARRGLSWKQNDFTL